MGLFDQTEASKPEQPTRDLRALSVATDDIRRRFGNDALSYGRELRFRDAESDTEAMDRRED
jgi:DNA polymerase-4